jgi:hypothetical protein
MGRNGRHTYPFPASLATVQAEVSMELIADDAGYSLRAKSFQIETIIALVFWWA